MAKKSKPKKTKKQVSTLDGDTVNPTPPPPKKTSKKK